MDGDDKNEDSSCRINSNIDSFSGIQENIQGL